MRHVASTRFFGEAAAPMVQEEAAAVSLKEVQAKLQAVVDQLLGEAVAPDQPLMEAGLDSIGAESSCPSIPGSHFIPR